MPGPRASRLAAASAAVALLCGCAHTEVIGSHRTLYVALSEYRLTPQSVRVSAGSLTIFVHNYGRLTHNLVISQGSQAEAGTRPIAPGETAELAITLSPGNYQMASTVLDDQALGAYGTLRVTS
jgi:plastocyanin